MKRIYLFLLALFFSLGILLSGDVFSALKCERAAAEYPELALRHEGDEAVFRVFDLEKLSVVDRKYRWLRSEEVTVNGKRIICRVIDFQDPNKNGLPRVKSAH